MKTNLLLPFGPTFALAAALAGCSHSATDDTTSSSQDISASWFATHIPHGSSEEKAVLELVNDTNMSLNEYVNECGFSQSVAAAIVDYRQGDEAATSLDDQEFRSIAQIDALPFTDQGFWNAALECSSKFNPPPTCTVWPSGGTTGASSSGWGGSSSGGTYMCCYGGTTGSTSSTGGPVVVGTGGGPTGSTTGSTSSGPVIVGGGGGTTGGSTSSGWGGSSGSSGSSGTNTGPTCWPYPSTSSSSGGTTTWPSGGTTGSTGSGGTTTPGSHH